MKSVLVCESVVREVIGLLFHTTCLWCGGVSNGQSFCRSCPSYFPLSVEACLTCGYPCNGTNSCELCRIHPIKNLAAVRSQFWLSDESKSFLYRMKSLSRSDLLSVLLSKLVQISNPFPHADFLVPVPMHPRRIIKRGFNQAQWLAHHLSSTWSIPVLDCSLEKIAETSAQKFLTLRARRKNLKGVFCWSGVRCERTRIVLIDDVYTTGATLDACAKVIKGAGAEAVYGWTLFRTELKKNGGKILPTVSNS